MEGNYAASSGMPSAPPPTFDEVVYGKKTSSHPPHPMLTPAPVPAVMRQVVTVTPVLGPDPADINCPHCLTNITTYTQHETNGTAHLCCLLLFLVGCFPCSCIPYCMDSMQTVQHTCPNCRNFLGSYRP